MNLSISKISNKNVSPTIINKTETWFNLAKLQKNLSKQQYRWLNEFLQSASVHPHNIQIEIKNQIMYFSFRCTPLLLEVATNGTITMNKDILEPTTRTHFNTSLDKLIRQYARFSEVSILQEIRMKLLTAVLNLPKK